MQKFASTNILVKKKKDKTFGAYDIGASNGGRAASNVSYSRAQT